MFDGGKIILFQERVRKLCEVATRETDQSVAAIVAKQAKDGALGNTAAVFPRVEALELGARRVTKEVLELARDYRTNLRIRTSHLADEAEVQLTAAIAQMRVRAKTDPHPGAWDQRPILPAARERLDAIEPEMLLAVREFRAGADRTSREGPPLRIRDRLWTGAKWAVGDPVRTLINAAGGAALVPAIKALLQWWNG